MENPWEHREEEEDPSFRSPTEQQRGREKKEGEHEGEPFFFEIESRLAGDVGFCVAFGLSGTAVRCSDGYVLCGKDGSIWAMIRIGESS